MGSECVVLADRDDWSQSVGAQPIFRVGSVTRDVGHIICSHRDGKGANWLSLIGVIVSECRSGCRVEALTNPGVVAERTGTIEDSDQRDWRIVDMMTAHACRGKVDTGNNFWNVATTVKKTRRKPGVYIRVLGERRRTHKGSVGAGKKVT